jgi:hypothetical protein
LQRTIPSRSFADLRSKGNVNQAIREAVSLSYAELKNLVENVRPDVLMCAVPMSLLELAEMPDAISDYDDTLVEDEGENTEEPDESEGSMSNSV